MIEVTPLMLRLPGEWRPKTHAQIAALTCPADFLKFGGAAGSLKSTTMLVAAAQQYQNPNYKAAIFRRSYPEIKFLMDRAAPIYKQMGAKVKNNGRDFEWPWGSKVVFRFCDKDADVHLYQGDEFQFLGFDESTHWKEWTVRFLISRLRTTDPSIKMQVFLATNPGGIGHDYHKFMFQGEKCWHCKPTGPGQREAFRIYHDAVWHSDKRPVGMSTCFIPGRVTDHSLLDADYVKKLKGMPEKLAKALLEGCWESFEGQYFTCWNPDRHVMPIDNIRKLIKPWWPTWVGLDWGFQHAAGGVLFTKGPDGKVYVIDESIRRHIVASEYGAAMNLIWGAANPQMWALSPDAFKHDGNNDYSVAEQMTSATGIGYTRAYNDRISGWQLCYKLLDEGNMIIGSNCSELQASIQTRVHADPPHAEDIAKVDTDADDLADAWRYGTATFVTPGERPKAEVRQELLDGIVDPTEQMMALRIMRIKEGMSEEALYYRGRARYNR